MTLQPTLVRINPEQPPDSTAELRQLLQSVETELDGLQREFKRRSAIPSAQKELIEHALKSGDAKLIELVQTVIVAQRGAGENIGSEITDSDVPF